MARLESRSERIVNILEDKKGEDVLFIDLRGSGYFVDAVIIATSLSDKHTQALLDTLKERLKPLGEEFLKIQEGEEWIVVDLGDILIHLMTKRYRERYNIEQFLEELKER